MRFAVVLALAGCGRIGFESAAISGDVPVACDFGPFSAPQKVIELNSDQRDWGPSVSVDGKSMIFSRDNGLTGQDFFTATRSGIDQPWTNITELDDPVRTGDGEDDPTLSADGNELIFGDGSIRRSRRIDGIFQGADTIFDDDNFTVLEGPELTFDGLTLYYNGAPPASDNQLFVTTRSSPAVDFAIGTQLLPDPDPTGDAGWPTISSDELELIFSSAHGGERDLFVTRRASKSDPFPPATRIDELSTIGQEDYDPDLSFDGTTIWFASDDMGGNSFDIYTATRSCL